MKEVIKVLWEMSLYLFNTTTIKGRSFFNSPKIVYCGACNAIRLAGGSYTRFAGNDCNGEHYENVEAPHKCNSCGTNRFTALSIYGDDIINFERIAPETLIIAIENGLKDLQFSSLYNEKLPAAQKNWGKLSKKEKLRQIVELVAFAKKKVAVKQADKSIEQDLEAILA